MNKKEKKAAWSGFAIAHLNDEVKAAVKKNTLKPADFVKWMEKTAYDGYKVAITYDVNNDCFTASLYAMYESTPNAGLMLSTRHVDIALAIGALVMLHDEVYEGSWPTKAELDW